MSPPQEEHLTSCEVNFADAHIDNESSLRNTYLQVRYIRQLGLLDDMHRCPAVIDDMEFMHVERYQIVWRSDALNDVHRVVKHDSMSDNIDRMI
jgi:hypothetical protein